MKEYRNKKEAILAGQTAERIYVGHEYYYWRKCPGCQEIKLVRSNAICCTMQCSRRRNINYHDQTIYTYSNIPKNMYIKFHKRVQAKRGKASKCIFGCLDCRYEWACTGGKYGDIDSYISLCKYHHNQLDKNLL